MSFYDAIRVGASGASTDLEIQRSLRFNDGDSANLTRTSSSTSNTFTYSAWIKRTHFSGYQYIFSMGGKGFAFHTTNNTFYLYDGSSLNESTARFRDPSAWYHVLVQINSGTATSYINNVLVHNAVGGGAFTLTTGTDATRIGNYAPGTYYFDGYMAEVNLVDGLVLAPNSFAKTDEVTGQWIPQKYVGAYGTNGFRLTFADNSGTTATTLGKDESGNGNNFTPNNFSVAANLTNDSMPDTPSNNFCTLNPLNATTSVNFGNLDGNLVFDQTSNDQAMTGTFFVTSGKWYWEIYKNASQNPEIGICGQETLSNLSTGFVNRLAFITNGGNLRTGSSSTTSITGSSSGQTGAGYIRIAVDMDNKKIWFSDLSGNYFNSGNPATGANPAYDFSSHAVADGWTPYVFMGTGGGHNCYVNFGQFDLNSFSSNIPAGFSTLTSENLPEPTILLPNKHFDIKLYTGTGSSNSITGLNFAPDWIWVKRRNVNGNHHLLIDQLRGGDASLMSNSTDTENTNANRSMTFNSNGVTWNSDTGNANASGGTYVLWNWDAGETDGKTYTVTVVDDSGNKFRFDGFAANAVTLDLAEGGTYIFNYPSGHPFRFSTTADGTHGGGSEYTTGVTHNSSTQVTIVVAASAPQLYYYCASHSGMGGAVNTNSTLGSSNFDGNLQSVTKVNATAGFSIVKWTSGANAYKTVGHGLGVKPDIVILKSRSVATGWYVYTDVIDGTNDYLQLNSTTTALDAQSYSIVPPTSTVFGTDGAFVSGNTNATMIAYVFSSVKQYSKIGTYKGNGNANGPYVYTGFRPAWVLTKIADTMNENWTISDNKRSPFNAVDLFLRPDETTQDTSSAATMDFYANGFKLRNSDDKTNRNGATYIYLAFAHAPFKNSRAR